MNNHWKRRGWSLSLFVLLALLPVLLTAAASAGYELSWWSVDGGGGFSSGGSYTLIGAIGQPEAGVMTGGGYTLAGGWLEGGALALPELTGLYLPMVRR